MGFRSNEYPGEHLQMEMIGFSLSLCLSFLSFFFPEGAGFCSLHHSHPPPLSPSLPPRSVFMKSPDASPCLCLHVCMHVCV